MKSFLLKYVIIPRLRKTYPFLTRVLNSLHHCRFPLKLNRRFFLSKHLLSGQTILQFDPSDHLTVKWVCEHLIEKLQTENVIPLVIDIGANDGFLSSNSYNVIRMGWNAVLIEPYDKNYRTLIKLLAAVKIFKTQIVISKMLGIGKTDGQKYLTTNIPGDVCDMEGKVEDKPSKDSVSVELSTLKTLFSKDPACHHLIRESKFIMLSIDVEGKEREVINQFLANGIYADIIIIETFRLDENEFNHFMKDHQYKNANVIHWNTIYIKDDKRPPQSFMTGALF